MSPRRRGRSGMTSRRKLVLISDTATTDMRYDTASNTNRDGSAEREQGAAERLPRERGCMRTGAVARESRVEVMVGDDLLERRPFGNFEEDEASPFDEGHGDDVPERQRVEGNRQPEAAERRGAHAVRDDHHALLVPAVDESAGRNGENEVSQGSGGRHYPGPHRRACRREHEQRKRDRRDVRTELRCDLPTQSRLKSRLRRSGCSSMAAGADIYGVRAAIHPDPCSPRLQKRGERTRSGVIAITGPSPVRHASCR